MFWFFGPEACRILAPPKQIDHVPHSLEGKVLNYWTARKVPGNVRLKEMYVSSEFEPDTHKVRFSSNHMEKKKEEINF